MSAVLFVAVYLVFVRSYIGQVIDERAFAGADAWKGDLIEFAHGFLDALPVASVVIGAVDRDRDRARAAQLAGLRRGGRSRRRRRT